MLVLKLVLNKVKALQILNLGLDNDDGVVWVDIAADHGADVGVIQTRYYMF